MKQCIQGMFWNTCIILVYPEYVFRSLDLITPRTWRHEIIMNCGGIKLQIQLAQGIFPPKKKLLPEEISNIV